jgi:anti-anti-sigma factor
MCTATVRQAGDVTIVDLNGKFTISDAPGLIRGTVAGALESGTRNILLNLARVTYMDSAAGIGELVSSYSSAIKLGARFKLTNPDRHIHYILHLLRLDTVLEIFDDENVAIESFRQWRAEDRG